MARKRVFIAAYQIREGSRMVYRFRPLIPDVAEMLPIEHSLLQGATRTISDRAPVRLSGLHVEPTVIQPALHAFLKEELQAVFKGDDIEIIDEATVESRLQQGVYSERARSVAELN
jgi:hypothetical protein